MSGVNYLTIKQKDGYITKLTHYICPNKPKASILILHGMAEHQNRYKAFADYLVGLGYDVYSYDHRGHGTDKKLSDLGFFASESGYNLVVEDAIHICSYIENNNRSNNFFLIGHSMGSVISRNVIQQYDKFNGVVLSGTPNPPKLLTSSGLLVSRLIKKMKGPKHVSPFLNNLMFGGKLYTSLCKRTAFDWLSRNNTIVGAYIHDPYCGYTCTTAFYHDLLKLIQNATKRKQIRCSRKDLPLYVLSGDKDPVGSYGKDVKKYITTMNKHGFTNISFKLYPDCRHEILNEINYEEVYKDVQDWISKRIK